ncbi:hypothetical protein HYT51_01665 [Candidatus Woesearchaeota archaeon]|nr:hypothetical protein [Candidatus Woesearchaeota archaeon]
MWPLPKKERKNFNAVVEGTYHDEWRNLNYKLTQIEVPEDTAVLNDGIYKYKLHGRTGDFKNVQIVNGESGGLETKIDFLGFCEGVVLPYDGGIPNILERPRAVCMRDGRIYVDEHLATYESYVDAISSVVKTAGEIFREKKFSELYDRFTRS